MIDTMKKIEEYFEREYNSLVQYLENCEEGHPRGKVFYKEPIANSLQRMLGAEDFALMTSDISFQKVDALYESYREKLKYLENYYKYKEL